MNRPLSIALLGTGYMASVHARHLRAQPGVRISAVCDTDPARSAAFVRDHAPGAAVFTDCATMLDEARPNALYLAIPPHAHDGQAELAAARGVHLFLEKPIARTLERGRSIAAAAERHGIITQVGYHLRHGLAVRHLAAAIADGSAGRPTLLQAAYRCNNLHAPWWRDRNRGGGQVIEQAIHLYDLACHLFGAPAAAWGQLDNLGHRAVADYTVEDTSVGMVRFANGALAAITASNNAVPGRWDTAWSVVCTRLSATFSDANHAVFEWHDGDTVRREEISGEGDPYAAETVEFLAALRGEGRASAPVAHGLRSLGLVTAITTSAALGGATIPCTEG
jgi:predicted dehydrogenase